MAYNAFISYSHTADGTLAAALQSALHRFAKPWYKRRALHIFRDETNLAVNPALWSSIRDALDQSSFFILFASREAAASPWVAEEAEYWIGKNGLSHFLIVLTGGTLQWDHSAATFTREHSDALPASLLRSFPEEPLFLDLRWARDGAARLHMREPRFHEAVLQLASTLHNRPKDELDGADIRFQRRARLVAVSGLIAVLLAALVALRETGVSREESRHNLAASLAATSAKVLADSPDRAREAALIAIESHRLNPSFEANQALRAAVSLLPAGAQYFRPEDSFPPERVRDMAFSPDGSALALTRDDGSTQLIDLVNHKPTIYYGPDAEPAARIALPGAPREDSLDTESAVSVAFDHTGSLLASGSRDGIAHVWGLPGGRELLRIVHAAPVSQVAFNPTAGELVTAGDDGHVRIFDATRAAILADFQCPGKIVSVSYSRGGDLLAALSEGVVSLFDPVHRRLVRTLTGGDAAFNLAFSGDGRRLATAGGNFAFVWDIATGRQLLKATHANSSKGLTPRTWIVDAAISPDGKFLAYAARGNKLAYVWEVDTGRQILELKHDSAAAAVAFNADGTKLGTGSYDGTARVWELPSGREIERQPHPQGAEVVLFSPDGTRFAAGGMEGTISVSEARRADRPAFFELPGAVQSVAFSPEGRRFAIGTTSVHQSPMVRIAETGGNTLREIEFHRATAVDKLFFLDSNNVIAQWSDKLFHIAIDQSSATPLPDLHGDKRIDPASKTLAIQQEGVSRLYTLPGLQETTTVKGPSASTLLRIAGGGKLLAFQIDKPPNECYIEIWSVASQARVSHITLPAQLNRVAFNASGMILFTAQSANLQAWDIPSGVRRSSITASDDIELIVPDPSSASFATLTHGHLTVWDSANGTRVSQLPDTGFIRSAAFSPDGRYLLTGYDEHSAALWLWRSADLRDQTCTRLASNLSHAEWARWFPRQPYRLICPNLPAGK